MEHEVGKERHQVKEVHDQVVQKMLLLAQVFGQLMETIGGNTVYFRVLSGEGRMKDFSSFSSPVPWLKLAKVFPEVNFC